MSPAAWCLVRPVPAALAFVALLAGCRPRIAPELSPRVVADAGRIVKARVVPVPDVGELAALALRPRTRGGPVELLAMGRRGYARLDPGTLAVRECVPFATNAILGRLTIRDVDGDGAVEFVSLGESWIGKTAVFDLTGALRWQDDEATTKRGPNATELVDFDGDGRLAFVTSFNVESKLRVVGSDGALRSEPPCGVQTTQLRAVDVDGDGRQELACLDGTAVRILDGGGHERARIVAPDGGFLSQLEVVRDPRPGPPRDCILMQGSTGVVLFDLRGARIELPEGAAAAGRRLGNHDGERVQVQFGGGDFEVRAQRLSQQAPIAGFLAARLHLRFLAADGACVYDEVLRARSEHETVREFALLAGAAGGPVGECVLVGYGGELLEYRAK